ncbi:MAG: RNA-binding cell elongation regulator Jag/EloR [Acidimicrobiales bacterium]
METTGRTVEEAKEAALDQLGVDETDAEFVVVSEPRSGLFGRIRSEARVRARVRPTSPRPKRGRTRRPGQERRDGGRPGRVGGGAGSGKTTAVAESAIELEVGSEDDDGISSNGSGQAPVAGGGAQRSRNRRRSRGGGGGSGTAASVSASGQGEAGSGQGSDRNASAPVRRERSNSDRQPRAAGGAKEEVVGEVLSLEEQGESAREFIEGLVRELGLRADVSMTVLDEDTAQVAIDGAELGILIGPGGVTLGALQDLARTVVQRRTGGQSERILVDVAGYRAKRAEALQRFTKQIADEVLSSGTEQALEPMSASDRKVVHDAVNEIDGVATRSEGEDPRRHIVISPVGGGSSVDVEDEDA